MRSLFQAIFDKDKIRLFEIPLYLVRFWRSFQKESPSHVYLMHVIKDLSLIYPMHGPTNKGR